MARIEFELTDLFDFYDRDNLAEDIKRMLAFEIKKDMEGCMDLTEEKQLKQRHINTVAQKIVDMQLEQVVSAIDKKAESKINELTNDKLIKIINQKMEKSIEVVINDKLSDKIDKYVKKLLEDRIDSIVQSKVKGSLKSMFK